MIRRLVKSLVGRLPEETVERMLTYPIFERNYSSIRQTRNFGSREELWEHVFKTFDDRPICVMEFGVFRGASLKYFLSHNHNPKSVFFGFDSFEGLPEDWATGGLRKGHFATAGSLPEFDDSRIKLVKGKFSDALPPFFRENKDLFDSIASRQRSLFIHFDADLFTSTLCVLTLLSLHADSYYFVFDEFLGGECRALRFASRSFGLDVEFLGHTLTEDRTYPRQVSGRIFRKAS